MSADNGRRSVSENASARKGQILGFRFSVFVAIAACLACLMAALLVSGCSSGGSGSSSGSAGSKPTGSASTGSVPGTNVQTEASGEYASGKHVAIIKVRDYGEIEVELDADEAPVSVSNFCALASRGYYDGLAFYRMVDGFCLQGGTAGNTASGHDSSLAPILGEFSGNKVNNRLADHFERGTIAMARTSDVNSATSTFFITLGSNESVSRSLNGQYAAFGTVSDSGMETVARIEDALATATVDSNGMLQNSADMPIIESVVIEK